jgi:hypothetical protein
VIELYNSGMDGVWGVYFPYNAERLAAFKSAANGTATWDQGLRQWLVNRRGIEAVRAWVDAENRAEADAQAARDAQAMAAYEADSAEAKAVLKVIAAKHAGRIKLMNATFLMRAPEAKDLNRRFVRLLMEHGFDREGAQNLRGIFKLPMRDGESKASHAQRTGEVIDAVVDLIWGDEDQVAGAVL